MENPLLRLLDCGQSVWLDTIRRDMMGSGKLLEELIRNDGLRGVTSNPAIFEKAIDSSSDYDDDIGRLGRQGMAPMDIYEVLALDDVGRAADRFRPVFDETRGMDGFVSIEVSPRLAYDPTGSVSEARRLWSALGRPNVMIKIPGTAPGLQAIRQLLREGVNINITLLFSLDRYTQVQEAYLGALEERLKAGQSVDGISSVASFFLSRIDTLLDPEIERVLNASGRPVHEASELAGSIAVASAKLAYQKWREVQASDRWTALARNGARPQRLLWASTSTKNARYSDTKYVEPLIGPRTINTMTLETLTAYRGHGVPATRLEEDVPIARQRIALLHEIGIDLEKATTALEQDGVRKFLLPLEKLLQTIALRSGYVDSTRPRAVGTS